MCVLRLIEGHETRLRAAQNGIVDSCTEFGQVWAAVR